MKTTHLIGKLPGQTKHHHEEGALHMAGSEQKPTHKQTPAETPMNFAEEDQRENRHEWVAAE